MSERMHKKRFAQKKQMSLAHHVHTWDQNTSQYCSSAPVVLQFVNNHVEGSKNHFSRHFQRQYIAKTWYPSRTMAGWYECNGMTRRVLVIISSSIHCRPTTSLVYNYHFFLHFRYSRNNTSMTCNHVPCPHSYSHMSLQEKTKQHQGIIVVIIIIFMMIIMEIIHFVGIPSKHYCHRHDHDKKEHNNK